MQGREGVSLRVISERENEGRCKSRCERTRRHDVETARDSQHTVPSACGNSQLTHVCSSALCASSSLPVLAGGPSWRGMAGSRVRRESDSPAQCDCSAADRAHIFCRLGPKAQRRSPDPSDREQDASDPATQPPRANATPQQRCSAHGPDRPDPRSRALGTPRASGCSRTFRKRRQPSGAARQHRQCSQTAGSGLHCSGMLGCRLPVARSRGLRGRIRHWHGGSWQRTGGMGTVCTVYVH